MIKPNFKKMYLISDEKFQALITNSSQNNSNGKLIDSQENTLCKVTETKQNNNQTLTIPDIKPIEAKVELDNGISGKCECDIRQQYSHDEKASAKWFPARKSFRKPFRKILTRKYQYRKGERRKKLINPKRKRETSGSLSEDEGGVVTTNKKKRKSIDNQIKPQKSRTRANKRTQWLNLK